MGLLNLHDVSDKLDGIIVQVSPFKREPEIEELIKIMLEAKEVLRAHSERILNTNTKMKRVGRRHVS